VVEGRNLLVLWAPGGQNRPYKAPSEVTAKLKRLHYYIRRYSSTVEAKGETERELLMLTASVPFDDRRCASASVQDLKLPLILDYLREVGSGLQSKAADSSLHELGLQMGIVDGVQEHMAPRHVGLLFFNEAPQRWLPGAQIDIVIFPKGIARGELLENTMHGPLQQQVRDALRFIHNNVVQQKTIKLPSQAEAQVVFNYPYAAVEEALVNAVYHRSYEQREPVEVRVHPHGIEIVSYPGPDVSIDPKSLNAARVIARRYRNRRIGEFLKELKLTEGRSTGIPTIVETMRANGSPAPTFSTDSDRTYFLVELPVHSAFDGEITPKVTPEVTPEVRLLLALTKPMNRQQLQAALGLKDEEHFRSVYLLPALQKAWIAMTIPDKPTSSKQSYRLTPKGRRKLALALHPAQSF
jgi:ATP-dependent DNA helicase RecG